MKLKIWFVIFFFQINLKLYSQHTLENSLVCSYKIKKKKELNLKLRIVKKNISKTDTILTYNFSIWKQLSKTVDSEYSNSLAFYKYDKKYYDILNDYEFKCSNGIYDSAKSDTLFYEGSTGSGLDWSRRYLILLPPKKSVKIKVKIRRNIEIKNQEVSIIDRHIKLKNIHPKNIYEIQKSTICIYCISDKMIQLGDSTKIRLW